MLFNLYDNDLLDFLYVKDPWRINIFPYTNDMVPMAHSQIVLRKLLQKPNTYFALNSLNTSKTKSKVMVFSIECVKYNQQINENPTEQENSFS